MLAQFKHSARRWPLSRALVPKLPVVCALSAATGEVKGRRTQMESSTLRRVGTYCRAYGVLCTAGSVLVKPDGPEGAAGSIAREDAEHRQDG